MNINQLDILLGSNSLYKEYKEATTYNPGDLCFFKEIDGTQIIRKCINETTGIYNDDDWENPKNVNGFVTILNDTIEVFDEKLTYESMDFSGSDILKCTLTFPKTGINDAIIRAFSKTSTLLVSEIQISLLNDSIQENTTVKNTNNSFLSFDEPIITADNKVQINLYFNIENALSFDIFVDKDTAIDLSNSTSYTDNPKINVEYAFNRPSLKRYTTSTCNTNSLLTIEELQDNTVEDLTSTTMKMEKLFEVYRDFYDRTHVGIDKEINSTDIILSSIEDKLDFINNYLNTGLPGINSELNNTKIDKVIDHYNDFTNPKNREIEALKKVISDNIDIVPTTLSDDFQGLNALNLSVGSMSLLPSSKNSLTYNMVSYYSEKIHQVLKHDNIVYILYGDDTSKIDMRKSSKYPFDTLIGTYDLGIKITKLWVISVDNIMGLNSETGRIYSIRIGSTRNNFSIDYYVDDICDVAYSDKHIVILKNDSIVTYEYDNVSVFDKHIYEKLDPYMEKIEVFENANTLYLYTICDKKIIIYNIYNNQEVVIDDYEFTDFKVSIYGTLYTIGKEKGATQDTPDRLVIYDFSTFKFVEIASEYLSFTATKLFISDYGINICVCGDYDTQMFKYNRHFNIIKKLLNPNLRGNNINTDGFKFIGNGNLYLYTYENGVYFNYIDTYNPSYTGLTNRNVIYSTSFDKYLALLTKDDYDLYTFIVYTINSTNEMNIIKSKTFTSDKEVTKVFLTGHNIIYYTIDEDDNVNLYYSRIDGSLTDTYHSLQPTNQIGIENVELIQCMTDGILYPIIDVSKVAACKYQLDYTSIESLNAVTKETIIFKTSATSFDDIKIKVTDKYRLFLIFRHNMSINDVAYSSGAYLYSITKNRLVPYRLSSQIVDVFTATHSNLFVFKYYNDTLDYSFNLSNDDVNTNLTDPESWDFKDCADIKLGSYTYETNKIVAKMIILRKDGTVKINRIMYYIISGDGNWNIITSKQKCPNENGQLIVLNEGSTALMVFSAAPSIASITI